MLVTGVRPSHQTESSTRLPLNRLDLQQPGGSGIHHNQVMDSVGFRLLAVKHPSTHMPWTRPERRRCGRSACRPASWCRYSPASCGSRRRDARARQSCRSDAVANVPADPVSRPRACRLGATGQNLGERGPLIERTAGGIDEDAVTAGRLQSIVLQVGILVSSGHMGVPEQMRHRRRRSYQKRQPPYVLRRCLLTRVVDALSRGLDAPIACVSKTVVFGRSMLCGQAPTPACSETASAKRWYRYGRRRRPSARQ